MITAPPQQGELTPFGIVPKYVRFKVDGIFDSGFYDYDSTWGFGRLSDAQKLESLGDLVSVLEFKIDDIYAAPQVGQELEKAAGQGFMTSNWMDHNRQLFPPLLLEPLVTFLTTVL